MTKRIRVFNTPEELVESAKKNAEYWLQKGVTFAFGRFGDAFMISPTDENGNQSGNASQMFFESHELCGRFFENFRMVVAHTPGRIRGSRISDIYQRIVFVPKKEETEETARMESGGINGTIMDGGKDDCKI